GHVAASRQVAFFRIAAAVDPVARHSAAVVAQLREARHLLAGCEALAIFVGHVHQIASIQLARDSMRISLVSIIPCKVADRVREYTVFVVSPLHGVSESIDDIEVGAAIADGLYRAVAPLRPAPAIDDAPLFLDPGRGGKNENFGGDSSRIGARPFPEARCFVLEQIGDHHPLELFEPRAYETRVGAAHCRILAEAEEPLQLAREHRVGEREEGVALSLKSTA